MIDTAAYYITSVRRHARSTLRLTVTPWRYAALDRLPPDNYADV